MNYLLFLFFIFICGCTSKPNTYTLSSNGTLSKSQIFLTSLKTSLISEYNSAKSEKEKQNILNKYHQRLQDYLTHHRIDSIKVTMDEVKVKGKTIFTKSHQSGVEFEYGLTFGDSMSSRIDSIYEFMKNLKEKSDTVVNFSFTGACQVNSLDSTNLSTFKIYAFPVPLQYSGN